MPLIHEVLALELAASLTYGQDPVNPAHHRFFLTPMNGPLPAQKCVYFLVDSMDRIQKVGMTDNANGLAGRLTNYLWPYPNDDATIQLYHNQMTTVLNGQTLRVFFKSYSKFLNIEVLGQWVDVEFTAHRFIETILIHRADAEGHPLWLHSQV